MTIFILKPLTLGLLIALIGPAVVNVTSQRSPAIELDGQLDGSILQYQFNAYDERADGMDTITIAYRIPTVGWAGIAFSQDTFMPNSEAIIGIPETGSVLKYNLNARSAEGIVPMQQEQQTLIDANIQIDQVQGTTTLVFTKIMNEPNEIAIVVGFNTMLGAWAPSVSFPAIHSRRQAFDIDLRTAQIFEAGSQVQQGEGALAPTFAPVGVPSPPSNNGGNVDVNVGANGFTQVQMNGQLVNSQFLFKVNQNDPNANGQDTITVIYTVSTEAWIAIGWSDNGGLMIGSEAVIALPDQGQVLKYQLTAKNAAGVIPFPDEQQTLIGTSVVQDVSSTTMTFTKILKEAGEIPLVLEGPNDFLGAWGSQNTLSIHSNRESFALNLANGGVEIIQTRKQSLWKAHGLLAGIAWGILSPMAIGASVIRPLFPGAMWFTIHRTLNMLVLLCTIAAFGIAVAAINQETAVDSSSNHFNPDPNPHKLVGLVIFMVAIIQALLGIFRPHNPDLSKGEVKTMLRKVWEVAHKVLGYSCSAIATYQVQSGIKIYNKVFGEADNALVVFWVVIAGIGGFVAFGFIGIKVTGYQGTPPVTKKDKPVASNANAHDGHHHTNYDFDKNTVTYANEASMSSTSAEQNDLFVNRHAKDPSVQFVDVQV